MLQIPLHLEKTWKNHVNITIHIQIIIRIPILILWFQEKNIPVFPVFGRVVACRPCLYKRFPGCFFWITFPLKVRTKPSEKHPWKLIWNPKNCCLNWVFLTMFQPLRFLMRTLYKFALFDTLTPMCFTFGVVKESSNPAPVVVNSLSSMNSFFQSYPKYIARMKLYENIPYKLSY